MSHVASSGEGEDRKRIVAICLTSLGSQHYQQAAAAEAVHLPIKRRKKMLFQHHYQLRSNGSIVRGFECSIGCCC